MKTLLAILLYSASAFAQTQTVGGAVQTVGGKVTLYGSPTQYPSDPHGIWSVNPVTHAATAEWNGYTLPLIGGCLGSNPCSALGNAVKGGTFFFTWKTISTAAPPGVGVSCGHACTGGTPAGYTDTQVTTDAVDWDTCNGSGNCPTPPHKKIGIEMGATVYGDPGAGNFNAGIPTWYTALPALSTIARTNQTTYGVINLTTSANITFIVGTLVGTSPSTGCIPTSGSSLFSGAASDGVTQCAQIIGASPSDLNGIYAICDSRTTGCSDPTLTSLSLYTTNTSAESGTASTGTVGNPFIDLDNSALSTTADKCGNGAVPMWWGQNFHNGYGTFLTHTFTTWSGDSRVAYLRPSVGGIGFEHYPATQNGASSTGTNCRAVLQANGYPSGEAAAGACTSGGCQFWQSFLANQFSWANTNLLPGVTIPVEAALSYTIFASPDNGAPVALASNAVASGFTLNSNGLRKANIGYAYPTQGSCDNNSCYAFDLHRGPRSYTWQPLGLSDPSGLLTPTGACLADSNCKNAANTGQLPPLLAWIVARGVQRIEPYNRDLECTEPGYSSASFGGDTLIPTDYAHCSKAGYLESFIALGKILN